jgi:hypothetical protein
MTRPAFSPVKPIDPELPKAAVRRLFDQAGGIKRTAAKLGYRGDSHVYAMADPAADAEITFAQVVQLTGHEAPACAEYLALVAGGVFLPLPAANTAIGALTGTAMRESGQAAAELIDALTDGLTPAEATKALPEIDDAVRAWSQLRSRVAAVAKGKATG